MRYCKFRRSLIATGFFIVFFFAFLGKKEVLGNDEDCEFVSAGEKLPIEMNTLSVYDKDAYSSHESLPMLVCCFADSAIKNEKMTSGDLLGYFFLRTKMLVSYAATNDGKHAEVLDFEYELSPMNLYGEDVFVYPSKVDVDYVTGLEIVGNQPDAFSTLRSADMPEGYFERTVEMSVGADFNKEIGNYIVKKDMCFQQSSLGTRVSSNLTTSCPHFSYYFNLSGDYDVDSWLPNRKVVSGLLGFYSKTLIVSNKTLICNIDVVFGGASVSEDNKVSEIKGGLFERREDLSRFTDTVSLYY